MICDHHVIYFKHSIVTKPHHHPYLHFADVESEVQRHVTDPESQASR